MIDGSGEHATTIYLNPRLQLEAIFSEKLRIMKHMEGVLGTT